MKRLVIFTLAVLFGAGISFAQQAGPETAAGTALIAAPAIAPGPSPEAATVTAPGPTSDADAARKAARAKFRRFEVGVRGGVNFADYSFKPVDVGDIRFSPGSIRTGYDIGFVMRLNLCRHVHLQSELNYDFVNYSVRAAGKSVRSVSLRVERFEIPVQLGFQFGLLRLYGGALFRLGESQRSSAPHLLRIGFNDSDIGITGGAGIKIRSFFLDFRVTGYPFATVRHDFRSGGFTQRIKVQRDLTYGASMGFFF